MFAEVCFLVGEEHVSTQAAQKIYTATEHVQKKFQAQKLAELDFITAQTEHIKKSKPEIEDLGYWYVSQTDHISKWVDSFAIKLFILCFRSM